MGKKKVIYISGPITGVPKYWEAFERAEDLVSELGYIVLTPSRLPDKMTAAQYMRIDFAMIDSADAVLFLPGWERSKGARLERDYCAYTDKPATELRVYDPYTGAYPDSVVRVWLKAELRGVLGND